MGHTSLKIATIIKHLIYIKSAVNKYKKNINNKEVTVRFKTSDDYKIYITRIYVLKTSNKSDGRVYRTPR